MTDKLTGRVRVRGGWFGKIVLQVEVLKPAKPDSGIDPPGHVRRWRDATVSDLSELHNLTYSRIDISVRLPDVPMPERELPGEHSVGKPH